eukprot:COSAG02_NODE_5023_length_4719_cov_21.132900_3_plen_887_part_00
MGRTRAGQAGGHKAAGCRPQSSWHRQLVVAVLAALVTGVVPSWSGPAARLLPSGRLHITGADGLPTETPSTWVAVNAPLQRVWHNSSDGWAIFDLQLRLARDSGVRVLSMVLNEWEFAEPSTNEATLASRAYAMQAIRRAISIWPEVFLVLRLSLYSLDEESVQERNISGKRVTPTLCCGRYRGEVQNASTVAGQWAGKTAARLRASLSILDQHFPARIIGVHLMALHTGEWFMPQAIPYGGAAPGPLAGFWDYSVSMQKDFVAASPSCATSIPSPESLNQVTLGNSWLDGSTPQSRCAIQWFRFMSASVARAIDTLAQAVKDESKSKCLVAAYNGYVYSLSGTPGNGHWALDTLLASGSVDMIASPLMYGPPTRAPWGAPLVMGAADSTRLHGKGWAMESDTRTFLCASVPAACAGNNFSSDVSSTVQRFRRNLGYAAVRGQPSYMLDLDTYGWLGQPHRLAESQHLWRGLSALLTTIAAISSETTSVGSMEGSFKQVEPAAEEASVPPHFPAQIAVFTDATSLDLTPLSGPQSGSGPGGGCGSWFQNGLKVNAMTLSTLGTSVLHLSTEDLLSEQLDVSNIRLVVFLNAVHLAPRVEAAIRFHFDEAHPATVVWLGASGLVENVSEPADTTRPSRLTGLPIQCNATTNSSLLMRFTGSLGELGIPPFDSTGGCRPSPACVVDPTLLGHPHFVFSHSTTRGNTTSLSDISSTGFEKMEVIATEFDASGTCVSASGTDVRCATMLRAHRPSPSVGAVVWTSAIGLPWKVWRSLALSAGVHLFVESNGRVNPPSSVVLGDSVSLSTTTVSGSNSSWLHLTAACRGLSSIYATTCGQNVASVRSVVLPSKARVADEGGHLVCACCETFATQSLSPGDVAMFRLRRCTS